MITYTVTIEQTDDNLNGTGEIETINNCSLSTVKNIQKRNCASIVTFKREAKIAEAPKSYYYRGEQIAIIEERQSGWTLVYSGSTNDGNYKQFFAVTAELEYR